MGRENRGTPVRGRIRANIHFSNSRPIEIKARNKPYAVVDNPFVRGPLGIPFTEENQSDSRDDHFDRDAKIARLKVLIGLKNNFPPRPPAFSGFAPLKLGHVTCLTSTLNQRMASMKKASRVTCLFLLHKDTGSTCAQLASLGLVL
jgi:hypothetical protein